MSEREVRQATGIISTTLLGVMSREFPLSHGNCCDLETPEGGVNIVNFVAENLQELIANRGLTWPVRVELLGPRTAVIQDPRIHDSWYARQFCTTCCPDELLPLPQQLGNARREMRGTRTVRRDADGQVTGISETLSRAADDALIGAPVRTPCGPMFISIERPGMSIGHTGALDKVDFK